MAAGPGEISVRDTGPGLTDEDLPHAFERFYLYDRYRSERAVGSGLGLAIVKELTAAMGGGVQAASPPGGGAEFTLAVVPVPRRRRPPVTPAVGDRSRAALRRTCALTGAGRPCA